MNTDVYERLAQHLESRLLELAGNTDRPQRIGITAHANIMPAIAHLV